MKESYIISVSKKAYKILQKSIHGFIDDHAIKLSASLSYYTVFSLPPLLIIIIYLCGIFFGEEAIRGDIFWQINGFVGKQAALQIQEIIRNVKLSSYASHAVIAGIILVIGASGVFSEMQSSIDFILGLKAKPKNGYLKFIKNRLLSFSMIGAFIFLLLVCLFFNTILDVLNKNLILLLPEINGFFYILNTFIVFIVIVSLFTVIFKLLPDGTIKWKYTFAGATFSALLFMLGKFAIVAYLGASNIASVYGAAGSVIIILIWVYYTAIILYFGAEIVKAYVHIDNQDIIPNDFSVNVEEIEIELPAK